MDFIIKDEDIERECKRKYFDEGLKIVNAWLEKEALEKVWKGRMKRLYNLEEEYCRLEFNGTKI